MIAFKKILTILFILCTATIAAQNSLVHYTSINDLPSNSIKDITQDSIGYLWFATHKGLAQFDGKTFTTLSPISSDDWQLKSTDMWFRHAFQNEKVYRYDGSNLYALQFPKPPNLPNPFEIYSIYKDKEVNIWFGTNPQTKWHLQCHQACYRKDDERLWRSVDPIAMDVT